MIAKMSAVYFLPWMRHLAVGPQVNVHTRWRCEHVATVRLSIFEVSFVLCS